MLYSIVFKHKTAYFSHLLIFPTIKTKKIMKICTVIKYIKRKFNLVTCNHNWMYKGRYPHYPTFGTLYQCSKCKAFFEDNH